MVHLKQRRYQALLSSLAVLAIIAAPLSGFAQTKIQYHSNKYSIQDDIKAGRQAAAEVEQQMPILRDQQARDYIERVGQRLVAAVPPEFQHPEFDYYFKIVNASDINAFALPGGPMYLNRGMIEAAHNEGEMAGVMAHELSHDVLRHGTAQATKAQKYSILSGIAGIAGTILGGPAVGQIAQAPFGVYFLKFSREYETEADVLGAQIMARAGYDPLDLAAMFRTIEKQGGGGGGFLSDHPSPKDRYARINREAQLLHVTNPNRDNGEFERIQARLRGYPRAQTTTQILQSGQRYPTEQDGGRTVPDNPPSGRVTNPSTRYRNYSELNVVRLNIPDNWVEMRESNSVWFAPEGGYGQYSGQAVFTHGANIGIAQTQNRTLSRATDELLNSLAQGNRNLRRTGSYLQTTVSARNALETTLSNVNEATGRPETIRMVTTQLRNGQLLYLIFVRPQDEARDFDYVFQNIVRSVRLSD